MSTRETIGELINDMQANRESRRDLEAEIKDLKAAYDALEKTVLSRLDKEHTDTARGDLASVTISETVVPSVTDWTRLMNWIKRNNRLDFFERRVSKSAWAEEVEARGGKRPIPGVEAFTKRSLNLRTR